MYICALDLVLFCNFWCLYFYVPVELEHFTSCTQHSAPLPPPAQYGSEGFLLGGGLLNLFCVFLPSATIMHRSSPLEKLGPDWTFSNLCMIPQSPFIGATQEVKSLVIAFWNIVWIQSHAFRGCHFQFLGIHAEPRAGLGFGGKKNCAVMKRERERKNFNTREALDNTAAYFIFQVLPSSLFLPHIVSVVSVSILNFLLYSQRSVW